MMSGALQVDLVPQGTLAERIRAGGADLAACLRQRASVRWLARVSRSFG